MKKVKGVERLYPFVDESGAEVLDPTPVELPIGYKHPKTLEERIQEAIRQELSQVASKEGYETFQEANDFDVGDDDSGLFKDEDDEFAVNDPHVQAAFEKEFKEFQGRNRLLEKEKRLKEKHDRAKAKVKDVKDDGSGDRGSDLLVDRSDEAEVAGH